jgi:hypothetical protein
VEDTDQASSQIAPPRERIDQWPEPAATHASGHGIDAEVAASEILEKPSGPDLREGSRPRVSLSPGGGDVDPDPLRQAKPRGPESRVRDDARLEACPQAPCQSEHILLHDEIDVEGRDAEEEVPYIPADGIDRPGRSDGAGCLEDCSDPRMKPAKRRELSDVTSPQPNSLPLIPTFSPQGEKVRLRGVRVTKVRGRAHGATPEDDIGHRSF